jgi:hypothetical protein
LPVGGCHHEAVVVPVGDVVVVVAVVVVVGSVLPVGVVVVVVVVVGSVFPVGVVVVGSVFPVGVVVVVGSEPRFRAAAHLRSRDVLARLVTESQLPAQVTWSVSPACMRRPGPTTPAATPTLTATMTAQLVIITAGLRQNDFAPRALFILVASLLSPGSGPQCALVRRGRTGLGARASAPAHRHNRLLHR